MKDGPCSPLDAKVRELRKGRSLRDRVRALRAWRAAMGRRNANGKSNEPKDENE